MTFITTKGFLVINGGNESLRVEREIGARLSLALGEGIWWFFVDIIAIVSQYNRKLINYPSQLIIKKSERRMRKELNTTSTFFVISNVAAIRWRYLIDELRCCRFQFVLLYHKKE